jgi:acyl carrier protein
MLILLSKSCPDRVPSFRSSCNKYSLLQLSVSRLHVIKLAATPTLQYQKAAELPPSRAENPSSLDGRLEQDYCFDSLGRVKLFLCIERRFGASLPEAVMAEVETPSDLLRAMLAASPAHYAHGGAIERISALAVAYSPPVRGLQIL